MAQAPMPPPGDRRPDRPPGQSVSPTPDPDRHRGRITPLWLSHHFPEDYDRCVLIGRSHVCRRCLVLYPLAIAVALLVLALDPPGAVDAAVLILLPLPALVELVLEQLGVLTYRPLRQMAVTAPLAVGLGWGFAIYFGDFTSRLFWGVVVGYTAIGVAAVAWRHLRRDQLRP